MPTEQEIAAAKAAEETVYVQTEEEKAWAEMQAEEAGAAAPDPKAPPENLDTFADDKQNDIDASSNAAAPAAPAAAAAPGKAPPSADKEALIRSQLEAQERARENATSDHAVRSITGRIEGMKRRLAEMAAERDREPDAADDKDEVAESLEALAADYPEVAEPVRKINSALDAKVSKLAEAENSRRAAADSALLAEIQANQALLEEKHPGWGKLLSDHSADFKTWIDDQPRRLRDGFYNNEKDLVDPDGAIAVLDAFKGWLEPPADPPPAPPANSRGLDAKRAAQLAATSTPASIRGKPVASGVQRDGDEGVIWKQLADMDPEEKPYRRA